MPTETIQGTSLEEIESVYQTKDGPLLPILSQLCPHFIERIVRDGCDGRSGKTLLRTSAKKLTRRTLIFLNGEIDLETEDQVFRRL